MPRRGRIRVRVEGRIRVKTRVHTQVGFQPGAQITGFGALSPGDEPDAAYCEGCGTWTPLPYAGYAGELVCDGCGELLLLEPE